MENYLDRLRIARAQKIVNKHSNCDSLYGHMSLIIDVNDHERYPNLKNTNPQTFILNKGDALIIPKNWWHYVESYENMYGCNFWTSEKLGDKPEIIKHNIKFDYDDIKEEYVQIWKSDQKHQEATDPVKFENFIKNKTDNEYFWTLKNYLVINQNFDITNKILNKIEIPDIIKNTNKNFEFNIMACSKKHATPLHYDDEYGLLCVTNGTKKAILYPPEDSVNLYPVKFEKYPWKNSPAIESCYNLYKKGDEIDGISSAELLYQTCKNNVGVLSSISKLIKKFHGEIVSNKTIWGLKKDKNQYKWELYNYEETTCNIKSFEIFPERLENGDYISDFWDEYFLENQNNDLYEGSIYRVKNNQKTKLGYFILDKQNIFHEKYKEYIDKLNYKNLNFQKDIVNKYKCIYNCIHQKNNGEFYIQYIGINKKDFLDFLIEHEYHPELVNYYEKENFNISNEITLVYDMLEDDKYKIKRTAFYGIV